MCHKMFFANLHKVSSSGKSLLASPLQQGQIFTDQRPDQNCRTHDHRSHSEKEVHADDAAIGVVIGILESSSNDPYDDAHPAI